jgi:hypothetical protein
LFQEYICINTLHKGDNDDDDDDNNNNKNKGNEELMLVILNCTLPHNQNDGWTVP